jgi:hypothetical protein
MNEQSIAKQLHIKPNSLSHGGKMKAIIKAESAIAKA